MKKIRKADIILLVCLLIIAFMAFVLLQVFVKKQGKEILIKVDGVVTHRLSLDEEQRLTVQGYQGGENVVVITNHQVYMETADCPDALCVYTGKISKNGETIVCLPHRVVVEIVGGREEKVDSIAK